MGFLHYKAILEFRKFLEGDINEQQPTKQCVDFFSLVEEWKQKINEAEKLTAQGLID